MALTPTDEAHALQIQAGTVGRSTGHTFESDLATEINSLSRTQQANETNKSHLFVGSPGKLLVEYICNDLQISSPSKITALSTGALATSEEGKKWLLVNGVTVQKCKSDIVVTICCKSGKTYTVGVSTKQCNNKTPTNAQLYFTTARGFSNLLLNNGIHVSDKAIIALRQFCGDMGFRPSDLPNFQISQRKTDPRRFFWEELDPVGRAEWEQTFSTKQNEITRLLLQKAYLNDPFAPDYVLHKTKFAHAWNETEVAIYSVSELVRLSSRYQGFVVRPYSVKKGSYKDPDGVQHNAPRFGVVQMQRGGQKQHPDQLQFNLEAGYFYKI
jgi:hypothetical protein